MKNFHVESRNVMGNPYIKVVLADDDHLKDVKDALESNIKSIKKVNVSIATKDLTVYFKQMYTADEVCSHIDKFLSSYKLGSPSDPIINDAIIHDAISPKAFQQIVDLIDVFGKNLEKTPNTYRNLGEEDLRNLFLPLLNSKTVSATGETFNKGGKTDILVQNNIGENLFIGECKLWGGKSAFNDAIDQLLSRYVGWRDEKVALIVFNIDVYNFTDILGKAKSTIEAHPLYLSSEDVSDPSKMYFKLRHPTDEDKIIDLAFLGFNLKY